MMREICGIFGFAAAIVFFIFAALLGIDALYSVTWGPASCAQFGEAMHMKTEWRFWPGCFVTLPDGSVMPREPYEKNLMQNYKVQIK